MKRKLIALVLGPLIIAGAAFGMYAGIKWAYGGYGHYYDVTAFLPRAGQQLETGSDVRMRGVIIGQIKSIDLVDRRVRLTLQIDDQFRVPRDAQAFVSLKTLLGAKFIDMRISQYGGPFLQNGSRVEAHIGPELETALQDGVQVLDAIRPNDLATVISTLSQASQGHGQDVARGLSANARLSGLFAQTIRPQLQALHDFVIIFGALRSKGVDLNRLARAINEGVPVYASQSAQRDLDKALRNIVPFSNNLADLLILNRRDWDRMMDGGDKVLGAMAANTTGLHDLVRGLYHYVKKLGPPPYLLRDGSAGAGFTNFIGGDSSQENRKQLCRAIPPPLRKVVPICSGKVP